MTKNLQSIFTFHCILESEIEYLVDEQTNIFVEGSFATSINGEWIRR